jgi:hypothetical protein
MRNCLDLTMTRAGAAVATTTGALGIAMATKTTKTP